MYTIWRKLTLIEDLLLGDAREVVNYLRTNYYGPAQQIRCMLRERVQSLEKNPLPDITDNSLPFRILPESDSPFDSVCDYVGFIFYSYDGKNEFTLNEHQCKRGDILIKDKNNIPSSSLTSKFSFYKQQVPNSPYDLLFKWYFKKTLDKRLVGLGITYEEDKWTFDAIIFGPEPKSSLFSPDEHHLLEMLILTWTKGINDQTSIRVNAQKMLDEQLSYVKSLLETQQSDMENVWTSKELNIAITTFEHDIQDEIAVLFQTTSVPNTYSNLRHLLSPEVQSKNNNKLKEIAKIFEHHRLTLQAQPAKFLLCQVWKQLKSIENWLSESDLNALFNFLRFNTFASVEPLFSIQAPPFLDQLGICPESDPFDTALDYVGVLIYLYNGQDVFNLNGHQCKRGQILIRQKQNIPGFASAPWHGQTSFASLFIHEYLYEWYFNEKPNELFQGIGFVYEQGKWKLHIITYAGLHGIHSIYDTHGDSPMASDMNEQRSIDLALSALYINNKWQEEELGCMYTIDKLETIGRDSFRTEIETITDLFKRETNNLTNINETCHETFNNAIKQYKPNRSVKSRILKNSGNSLSSFLRHEITNNHVPSNSKDSKPSKSEKHPAQTKSASFKFPIVQLRPTTNSDTPRSIFRRSLQVPKLVDSDEQDQIPPPLPPKKEKNTSVSSEKDTPQPITTLYQLWRELCLVEQTILGNPELNEFISYLNKKEYLNRTTCFTPLDNQVEEYNLMAKVKINGQLEYIRQLFHLKESRLTEQQPNQHKKHFELFDAFIQYYNEQIEIVKKLSK